MKKRKRYCYICDTEIEKWTITDKDFGEQIEDVCKECSKITYGYYKEEKELVKELRDWLSKNDYWKIEYIVAILRKFLKKKHKEVTKMYTQEVIDFIEKLWFYADREEMSMKEYIELGKKRKEVIEYIRKLSGVH